MAEDREALDRLQVQLWSGPQDGTH
jgi:hypothetical protein